MDAKELIIKLIDTNAISGEEALILFEAINKPGEIKIEPITVPVTYPYIPWTTTYSDKDYDYSKYNTTCTNDRVSAHNK